MKEEEIINNMIKLSKKKLFCFMIIKRIMKKDKIKTFKKRIKMV